jgi:6-phosphogluconolactonase (cycloisomerase 2 family)
MSVAVDTSGKFVYAVNAGSNNIMAFTINRSTGGLTPMKGSPYSHDATPFAVAIAGQ